VEHIEIGFYFIILPIKKQNLLAKFACKIYLQNITNKICLRKIRKSWKRDEKKGKPANRLADYTVKSTGCLLRAH
jgi:hypothetical protein